MGRLINDVTSSAIISDPSFKNLPAKLFGFMETSNFNYNKNKKSKM